MKKNNLSAVEWTGRFAHQKALLFNEAELDSKGSKIQVIKIEAGGKIKPHYHKVRTEVFYVLKGTGAIRLGGDIMDCQPDDFMLCPINTVHGFENMGTEDFVVCVFRTNDPGDSDMIWVDKHET